MCPINNHDDRKVGEKNSQDDKIGQAENLK